MADIIGGALSKAQGTAQAVLHKSGTIINGYVPPDRREELWSQLQQFVYEKPALASFLIAQLVISGPLLAIFLTATVTAALFALIGALLVGLLGTVLFIAVTIGFALIFVLPTLFFTTLAATVFWFWGMAAYYVVRSFRQRELPNIHLEFRSGKSAGKNTKALTAAPGDGGALEKKYDEHNLKLEAEKR